MPLNYLNMEQNTQKKQGLILVDTKYEFGKRDGEIYIDRRDSHA